MGMFTTLSLLPLVLWMFCFHLPKEEELFFFGRELKLCYIIQWERRVGEDTEKPAGTCRESLGVFKDRGAPEYFLRHESKRRKGKGFD